MTSFARVERDLEAGSAGVAEPALVVRDVDKWFGGTHALRQVSLSVRAGDVHAIVGENGAGKSTLVKIIAGVYAAGTFGGELRIEANPYAPSGVHAAEQAGIFLVPQELNVVPETTVAENLFLGREHGRLGFMDYRALWSETQTWIEAFRLDVEPTTAMRRLSAGQQQLVKIARAMIRGVRVLILDEPTASLTETETELLFGRIAEFHQLGVTTLYISHRLPEVSRVADRVTIMRDGTIVETLDVRDPATTPGRIVRSMVGRDIEEMYPRTLAPIGDLALEVRHLVVESLVEGRPPHVDNVSLSVRQGEIVGVFGAIGSGTAQLAAAIFGVWPGRAHGAISLRGREVSIRHPRDAIAAGIGYVAADRKRTGLVPRMSVGSNITLVALASVSPRQWLDEQAELTLVQRYIRKLRIQTASADNPVSELSGGNQQKVVASKWLAAAPSVIILEEPTQGIDVGAKLEIYTLMNELAHDGRAILFISSDLQEVLAMADRGIVLYRGGIARTWEGGAATEHDLAVAATGGDSDA